MRFNIGQFPVIKVQVSTQDLRLSTPFLGQTLTQGDQTLHFSFPNAGFLMSSSIPSVSVTWNSKPQPPLAQHLLLICTVSQFLVPYLGTCCISVPTLLPPGAAMSTMAGSVLLLFAITLMSGLC